MASGMFGGGQQTNTFGGSKSKTTGVAFGSTPSTSSGFIGQNNQTTEAGLIAPPDNTTLVARTPRFSGFSAIYYALCRVCTFLGALRSIRPWLAFRSIPSTSDGFLGHNNQSTGAGLFTTPVHNTALGAGTPGFSAFRSTPSTSDGFLGHNNQSTGAGLFTTPVHNTALGAGTPGFSDSENAGKWQKTRVQIRKQYEWLKAEISKFVISEIADNLYNDEYLVLHEYERIVDNSLPRRKRTDLLLKKVILGNLSIVPAFMRILKENIYLLFIAERISKTDVSPEEMHGRPSVGRATSGMFHISDNDTNLLRHCMFDEVVVDQLNDSLLSNFFICICEHCRICDYPEVAKKFCELLELMKKCPDEVYYVLKQVLTENNHKDALQKLERNRILKNKRAFPSEYDNSPSAQKRMRIQEMHSDAEMHVCSALGRANAKQKLQVQASRQLHLKLKNVFICRNTGCHYFEESQCYTKV